MSFQQIQAEFMAHIKDPDVHPAPEGIEDRRMQIYRELFFNNIEGFVASTFPVLKSLYEEQTWLTLVREFFSQHDCQSPYFLEISREFLFFLQEEYTATPSDPPFILELAHYEWTELEVAIAQEVTEEVPIPLPLSELSGLHLAQSARSVSYQYPVHQISVEHQPHEPSGPHCFIVYRDRAFEVQFIETNPMTALLIQNIVVNPGITIGALAGMLAEQFSQFDEQTLINGAIQTLSQFVRLGILVDKKA
ncbi:MULTISPECIES: putative DNA-binding domain-containing protein [unclassified Pseudoalteromonas]|uniref:HvfC family RiPP maturation protein n=1 Tax=unclassified Pseudoalteromonas TaxID=194690 RepID=UPI002097F3CB|nr:putative DNA-binding domain-containing protein [Pseudoalteromonas sp. XMcav2-N]MCO7188374.1 putative DNA-binding domain-containing protein [Pseudoalteromonas sp. XMcav2-N]